MLLLENINKNYVQGKMDVPVLHDISLSIEEGEYVAIMGPSGSGKSTLMNIIGCLDKPTSGSYILDGTEVANMKDKELSKVRNKSIGFVFQNFNLLPRQSALQNVELPLQYAKVPRRERRPKCVDALTSVDLQDRMSFKPTQLSGGQKQRVAIARAMVNSPKILLADEPTGALDSKSGIQVMGLFEKLHNEGVTIIMITHAREIAEYADRIITIFDGRITKDEKNLNKVVADYKTDENTAAAGGSDAKTPEGTAGITEENVSAAAEAALYDEGVSEEASFSNASDRLMSILNEESEGDEE
ncbi:MAG: ABC transporter ATP-binding protein [Eubacterium sp.]|nr:ABC transporter ATP-binding protein [Eubacterium sp.]